MALAEARVAWQRAANRCLVQEDAKRAPKLACSSSLHSSVKDTETVPTTAADSQDNPISNSLPFYRAPSYSNLSPSTKWWLQMQPNYKCQRGLTDENPSYPEDNNKNCQMEENEDDFELVKRFVTSETKGVKVEEERLRSIYHQNCQDPRKIEFKEDMVELGGMCIVSSEGSKRYGDLDFDSEPSWVVTEKNTPWWRTADTEELAILVTQRSCDLIENCDLPSPHNVHFKNTCSPNTRMSPNEIPTSLRVWKSGVGVQPNPTHDSSPATSGGSSYRNLRMTTGEQLLSSPKYSPRHGERAGKAELLEALRHSQTRAREAETVAKQACAEKEHVVKLMLRQAQQLFAYKQWVQLLQLENMYIQLKNNKLAISPWTTHKTRRPQKGWMKSCRRNRSRRSHRRSRYNVGEYAVIIALSLGLVGAGLLLGWSVAWMLPMW